MHILHFLGLFKKQVNQALRYNHRSRPNQHQSLSKPPKSPKLPQPHLATLHPIPINSAPTSSRSYTQPTPSSKYASKSFPSLTGTRVWGLVRAGCSRCSRGGEINSDKKMKKGGDKIVKKNEGKKAQQVTKMHQSRHNQHYQEKRSGIVALQPIVDADGTQTKALHQIPDVDAEDEEEDEGEDAMFDEDEYDGDNQFAGEDEYEGDDTFEGSLSDELEAIFDGEDNKDKENCVELDIFTAKANADANMTPKCPVAKTTCDASEDPDF
ncbi:hypothetical protein BGW39_007830 [Mortierella sp. 14UC]|nr:hypothetical protein BGW39_007830 [Mortierella sp. 14UC]